MHLASESMTSILRHVGLPASVTRCKAADLEDRLCTAVAVERREIA